MNNTLHPSTPRCAAFAALAVLAAFPISSALAGNVTPETVKELAPITINRAKNPGDLPYVYFKNSQALLQSFLPAEPHVIEMRYRLSFTGITGPARDEYVPDTWSIAIVGDTVDHTIPVERGGYFLLPELELAAKEKATVMFNTRTRKSYLNVAWKFRIAEGEGRIEIDGAPAITTSLGSCQVLRFDPAVAATGNARIAFIGALDIVTLHEIDT